MSEAAQQAWDELVQRYPIDHPSMPVVDWNAIRAGFDAGFAAGGIHALEQAAHEWLAGDAHAVLFNKAKRDEPPEQRIARWLRARAASIVRDGTP